MNLVRVNILKQLEQYLVYSKCLVQAVLLMWELELGAMVEAASHCLGSEAGTAVPRRLLPGLGPVIGL